MIEAVFVDWSDSSQTGIARSSDGHDYRLRYRDGQSFLTSDDQPIPMFTGRHSQPAGGQLKVPEIGDPVLVQVPISGQTEIPWSYMRPYLEMVERRYGTKFLVAD